jgi:hypothetical protein
MKKLNLLSVIIASILFTGLASAGPANKVYRPIVEKGETELEFRGGYRDYGSSPNEYAYVFDFGYGVTDFWKTEFVVEYSGTPGMAGRVEAYEWENIFRVTEQGKHWLDFGILMEYEVPTASGPDELKLGALFEKEIGPTITDLNLIFEREIGGGASNDIGLDYAWQVKWRGNVLHEWGVQGFGGLGTLDNFGDGDKHSIGPAIFGVKRLASGNKIAYDAAILVGLNNDAPNATIRFNIEYEIY